MWKCDTYIINFFNTKNILMSLKILINDKYHVRSVMILFYGYNIGTKKTMFLRKNSSQELVDENILRCNQKSKSIIF